MPGVRKGDPRPGEFSRRKSPRRLAISKKLHDLRLSVPPGRFPGARGLGPSESFRATPQSRGGLLLPRLVAVGFLSRPPLAYARTARLRSDRRRQRQSIESVAPSWCHEQRPGTLFPCKIPKDLATHLPRTGQGFQGVRMAVFRGFSCFSASDRAAGSRFMRESPKNRPIWHLGSPARTGLWQRRSCRYINTSHRQTL